MPQKPRPETPIDPTRLDFPWAHVAVVREELLQLRKVLLHDAHLRRCLVILLTGILGLPPHDPGREIERKGEGHSVEAVCEAFGWGSRNALGPVSGFKYSTTRYVQIYTT